MIMVGCVLLFVCLGPNRQNAADYITGVHASFMEMEQQYQIDQDTETTQEVPSLLERAEENAQVLVDNGTIDSFEVSDNCVYMETTDGVGMVYLPGVEETIPEDELPEIFQRFHKSDRSRSIDREGLGLGLYIVKNILDAMGEDIWVRSKDGETEFRFSLSLE